MSQTWREGRVSFFHFSLPPSLFPHHTFPRIQRRMQENHAVVFIDGNRRQTERAGRSRAAAADGPDDDVNANMWVNGSTQASSVSYCSLRVSLCRTTCLFIVPLHSQTHPGMIRAPIERKKLIWTSSWPEGRERVCVCVHLMNRGKHSKNVPSSYMPNALLPRVLVDSS